MNTKQLFLLSMLFSAANAATEGGVGSKRSTSATTVDTESTAATPVGAADFFELHEDTKNPVLTAAGQGWLLGLYSGGRLNELVAGILDAYPDDGATAERRVSKADLLNFSSMKYRYNVEDKCFCPIFEGDLTITISTYLDVLIKDASGPMIILHSPATEQGCAAIWSIFETAVEGTPFLYLTPIWNFLHRLYVPGHICAPPLMVTKPVMYNVVEKQPVYVLRLLAMKACLDELLKLQMGV